MHNVKITSYSYEDMAHLLWFHFDNNINKEKFPSSGILIFDTWNKYIRCFVRKYRNHSDIFLLVSYL